MITELNEMLKKVEAFECKFPTSIDIRSLKTHDNPKLNLTLKEIVT